MRSVLDYLYEENNTFKKENDMVNPNSSSKSDVNAILKASHDSNAGSDPPTSNSQNQFEFVITEPHHKQAYENNARMLLQRSNIVTACIECYY